MIDGRDLARLPDTDRDISMVFQSYALFPHLTVLENIAFGVRFSGVARRRSPNGRMPLELVASTGFRGRLPSQLSGGQQQRVALARALVLEPRVLLFDEPLSNLDAKLRVSVRSEIRRSRPAGTTSVYVTHDQAEAMALSDVVVVMNAGRVEQSGPPAAIYRRPVDAFRGRLHRRGQHLRLRGGFGVAAAWRRCGSDRSRLTLPSRGRTARVRRSSRRGRAASASRPPARRRRSPGTLSKVTYVGSHLEFVVATERGEVFAVSNDVDAPYAAGQAVGVGFAERGPVLIAGN